MEIILAPTCESLTGSLNKTHGYSIRKQQKKNSKPRFFGQRSSKGSVPPDGHWRFIADCAELAASGLIIADIRVSHDERAAQGRFGVVAAAVAARAKDLSKVTTDQQNFLAQKDLPNGKKTMKSYLWSLELAAYDEEHS